MANKLNQNPDPEMLEFYFELFEEEDVATNYYNRSLENGQNMLSLKSVTAELLLKFGITNGRHRARILNKLEQLEQQKEANNSKNASQTCMYILSFFFNF